MTYIQWLTAGLGCQVALAQNLQWQCQAMQYVNPAVKCLRRGQILHFESELVRQYSLAAHCA
jgi:hypothetical protein